MLVNTVLQQYRIDEKGKYVVIFGAGKNGMELFDFLSSCNIKVDFFCDNNEKKQGVIKGVPCVSFQKLCEYKKEDIIVFISPYKSDEIIKELKDHHFPFVIPSDFLKMLHFIPGDYKEEVNLQYFPPFGHFYSLYPDIQEILRDSGTIFDAEKRIYDIQFNVKDQLSFLNNMISLYPTIPNWPDYSVELGTTPLRYRYGNPNLTAADAIGLHCMLRILEPRKMIEVGSGYTSAVTLDTSEFYLQSKIKLTFIEPFPNLLKSILKDSDDIKLMEAKLQDIPVETFEELDSGDVLFIDSTHVSKINSDVNYLFFEILPRLKKGVYIHLHDIFYPFEYPKQWIMDGMIWNELYLLRAFLQNNTNYSIVYFHNMMEKKYKDAILKHWPIDKSIHGGSIWIRKNV